MAIYAVMTGDIVDSSLLTHQERASLLQLLDVVFAEIKEEEKAVKKSFEIFRGDSFQGLLNDPGPALRLALKIRLKLIADKEKMHPNDWDARIAIGIGEVSYQAEYVSTSDGPAFRYSGPILDEMKREDRIKITSFDAEFNEEMKVSCSLLDAVSSRWTSRQAAVMLEAMKGLKQGEIAAKLGISQPAISKMLTISHWDALESMMKRYETLVNRFTL
ncbi:MAG: SatD family protein [Bacteroidota bacterium]